MNQICRLLSPKSSRGNHMNRTLVDCGFTPKFEEDHTKWMLADYGFTHRVQKDNRNWISCVTIVHMFEMTECVSSNITFCISNK